MTLHVIQFTIAEIPSFVVSASPVRDRWFGLTLERNRLRWFQRNLAEARRHHCSSAIKHWERLVCIALDAVWEAQEDWKAARRHFT